jgi:hypothetical protein
METFTRSDYRPTTLAEWASKSASLFPKPRYIYIAGPYSSGDTVLNVRNAVLAAEELIKLELIPYIPHLTMFWHIITPHDYEFWLNYDLNWLDKCDGLLRLPGASSGADKEVEHAQNIRIPIYYFIEELR